MAAYCPSGTDAKASPRSRVTSRSASSQATAKAKDLPHRALDVMNRLQRAAILDVSRRCEDLAWPNLRDRHRADDREDVLAQPVEDFSPRALGPFGLGLFKPQKGHHLESVGRRRLSHCLGAAARLRWIFATPLKCARLVAASTRLTKRHFRIWSEREPAFLARRLTKLHAPQFGTGWDDFKVESATIEELVSPLPGLGLPDLGIAQRCDGNRHYGGI